MQKRAIPIEDLLKVYDQIITPYKRHTLYRPKEGNLSGQNKRLSALESVWTYTHSIVSKIQTNIEKRMLEEYLKDQTNAAYTQEIRDAYKQRMFGAQ